MQKAPSDVYIPSKRHDTVAQNVDQQQNRLAAVDGIGTRKSEQVMSCRIIEYLSCVCA
jgi:hypothetical protein